VSVDLRGFRSGSLNVLGGVVAEPLVRARSATDAGDGDALRVTLERLAVSCCVEGRNRLAVLRGDGSEILARLTDRGLRIAVVDAARSQGFTHVALDLESVAHATVRRD
jgi:hypothetical protein